MLCGQISMTPSTKPKNLFLAILLVLCSYSASFGQPPSFSSLANPGGSTEPLTLEQAFPFVVSTSGPGQYRVIWDPAPGHYLYRHAFNISLLPANSGELLATDFTLPDGLKKTDEFFGDIEAYYDQVVAEMTLPTVPGPGASLLIEYQGCADWGFCYPPQKVRYSLTP